jgi:hypothetical protein
LRRISFFSEIRSPRSVTNFFAQTPPPPPTKKCPCGAAPIGLYKVKEKLIYFYSLCVNYNNSSPTVGNDSLNGSNCCRRAAIIYELTNNILKNNIKARLIFNGPYHGHLAMVVQYIKSTKEKMHLLCWPFR